MLVAGQIAERFLKTLSEKAGVTIPFTEDVKSCLKMFAEEIIYTSMNNSGIVISEATTIEELLSVPIWGTTYCIDDLFQEAPDYITKLKNIPFEKAKSWALRNASAIATGYEDGITTDWTTVSNSIIPYLSEIK